MIQNNEKARIYFEEFRLDGCQKSIISSIRIMIVVSVINYIDDSNEPMTSEEDKKKTHVMFDLILNLNLYLLQEYPVRLHTSGNI